MGNLRQLLITAVMIRQKAGNFYKKIAMNIETVFIESAIQEFRNYKKLADETFKQLKEKDFHFRHAEESNSIAIIIQHIHGNMLSRWTNFLVEDGEKDWRQRDAEFEEQDLGKEGLIIRWEEGWNLLFITLQSLMADDLLKTISIRLKPMTVVSAIHRQLAHYSYHVGQIVMIGKDIKEKDWETLSIPKRFK